MELTDDQFRQYNNDFIKKYGSEVQEHGNGGFRTVTNRKTATRHALERLVADLEPVQPFEPDPFYPNLLKSMQQEALRLRQRLDYVELQLSREAKFKNRERIEDRRFFRAFDVLTDVKSDLTNLSNLRGPWAVQQSTPPEN